MRLIVLILVAVSACGLAVGQDKSEYHLFNPTPRELMRELSTDRPDTTESPNTVDAGHVQVEMSFLEYSRDGSTDAISVAPTNFKIGLTNYADLQLVVQPYLAEESSSGDVEGFGDMQLRLKVNLWGNDGGETVFAVMPFVQFPTGGDDVSSNKVEGGIIFPFGITLPHEFDLTMMAEFDVVRNSDDDDYRLDFVHTAALSHDLVGSLGGFVEYVGVMPFESGEDYLAFAAAGLTCGIGEDVQLDTAVQFGLVEEAEDVSVLVGVSFRF